MNYPDPEPPPIQSPPIRATLATPFPSVNPYQSSQVAAGMPAPPRDLSTTDGRTVAGLVLLGVGVMSFLTCFFIAPIAPIAGLIAAAFGKPSTLRTVAIVGNAIVLAISVLWLVGFFWDMATDPVLGPMIRNG